MKRKIVIGTCKRFAAMLLMGAFPLMLLFAWITKRPDFSIASAVCGALFLISFAVWRTAKRERG